MIIKEFRIVIPMSVEQYQVGQLYTIQKKSRIESVGAGSGVEIIENRPFEQNEAPKKGQYTLKVYHVDERLPASLKTVTKLLFPKSALLFEEEAWNAYPYARTKYRHKLFKSFNIDVESKYLADCGQTENTFNLSKSELAMRQVDYIDIVNDPVNPHEYNEDEDPALFVPKNNKSWGPLAPKWMNELKTTKTKPYMCCYKLCRITCAFWGCQSRVEKSIADSVLRNMLLMTHRQAWTWQDEYCKLTIADVRRLEEETQRYLMMKMKETEENSESTLLPIHANSDQTTPSNMSTANSTNQITMSSSRRSSVLHIERLEIDPVDSAAAGVGHASAENMAMRKLDSEGSIESCVSSYFDITNSANSPTHGLTKKCADNEYEFGNLPDQPSNELAFNLQLLDRNNNVDDNNYFEDMVSQNSNNIDEFYDAISQASQSHTSLNIAAYEQTKRKKLIKLCSISDSESSSTDIHKSTDHFFDILPAESSSSPNSATSQSPTKHKSLASKGDQTMQPIHEQVTSSLHKVATNQSLRSQRVPSGGAAPGSGAIDTLVMVVHGGNVTCTDTSKKADFVNFKATMDSVAKEHYKDLMDHIAYRLVPCEPVCKESLLRLANCSPVASNESPMSWDDEHQLAETSADAFALHENLPFATIPLLLSADQPKYRESVQQLTHQLNRTYADFLATCPYFNGRVCIIGDAIGALLVYDVLNNLDNLNLSEDLSSASSLSNLNSFNSKAPSVSRSTGNGNYHRSGAESNSPSPVLTRRPTHLSMLDTNHPQISISNVSNANSLNDLSASTDHNNNNNSTNVQRCNSSGNDSTLSCGIDSLNATFLTPHNNRSSILSTANGNLDTDQRLEFEVSHFFVFGSPLGLVLTYRRLANKSLDAPICTQMYNLFHLTDPGAIRVEPILCKQFRYIQPCTVPRFSKFPLGDGYNLSLDHFIVKHGNLFDLNKGMDPSPRNHKNSLPNSDDQLKSLHRIIEMKKNWWGDNRLDYVLYSPEKIANLPKQSLPYIFHSCFWESTDVSAFILRMLTGHDNYQLMLDNANGLDTGIDPLTGRPNATKNGTAGGQQQQQQTPAIVQQKWERRLNRLKVLRNFSPNHRSNDVIVNEDKEQLLSGRFSYGPLDFVLAGEHIDIFIMKDNQAMATKQSKGNNEWEFLAHAVTDSHGKVAYVIPPNKRLSMGMYQVKMVVKCDHSYVEFYMAVLPAHTQAVVFSIDGSFAANISISGTDPKVRAGAVDVVRHWQDLGYLIIYVTARPDIQHYKVTNWLAQHNFPLGMVFFSQLRHDPIKQKAETLKNLVVNNNLKLEAAYGSPKDIAMYANLGVLPNRTFIIAKALKTKHMGSATLLKDGYATHLTSLKSPNAESRQASGNARLFLRHRTTFSIRLNPMFEQAASTTSNSHAGVETQLSITSTLTDPPNSPHSPLPSAHLNQNHMQSPQLQSASMSSPTSRVNSLGMNLNLMQTDNPRSKSKSSFSQLK